MSWPTPMPARSCPRRGRCSCPTCAVGSRATRRPDSASTRRLPASACWWPRRSGRGPSSSRRRMGRAAFESSTHAPARWSKRAARSRSSCIRTSSSRVGAKPPDSGTFPASPVVSTLVGVERKLATVLFVDLVGSTALVSGTDPEVARRRVQQYFDRVQQCVISHGGIVEKFAGDAVMAAFGIPQAHEDDAERAMRAALAIIDSVTELGLEARIGVESGEVVVDSVESTFATGEAVNVAARLQQAAAPNAILIGPAAHRLTLGCFEVEDEGPVEARGLAEPVWTWRILDVTRTEATRRFAAPLVGRDAELELLENTYTPAVRDRRAHLFTIYGEPGVGKSRLAREFIDGLESATILFGRALPYGEGVTYSALADMVKVAAGIADDDPLDEAIEKLRDCCPDEAVADLMGLATS